jgi:signal peptidase I
MGASKKLKKTLIGLLIVLVIAAAVLKLFVFELPKIAGDDMAPTLQPGDMLLANRLASPPARGQLVLMEHPQEHGRLLIRRVVGLPGERVTAAKETPAVNGTSARRDVVRDLVLLEPGQKKEVRMKLVEETLLGVSYQVLKDPGRRSVDPKPVALGSATYYVLADNRNHGTDSRTFGPVPADHIRAVITHRLSAGPGCIKDQPERPGWVSLTR